MKLVLLAMLTIAQVLAGAENHFLRMEAIKIATPEHKSMVLDFQKSKLTVVVLLQQGTCSGFMVEKEYWNKVSKEFEASDVRIVGIYIVFGEGIENEIQQNNYSFPIYMDEFGEARRSFSPRMFPMKYVFDQKGELLYLGWPTRFRERDDELINNVKYLHYLLIQ